MTSFRTLVPAALCAVALVGATLPASAEPFRGGGFDYRGGDHRGWDHRGWGHHYGWGPGLAIGGLGLATGAVIAGSAYHPAYACGETITTHRNAAGQIVKVVRPAC